MEQFSVLQELIIENNWEIFQPLMERLQSWEHWPLFLRMLADLQRDRLYESLVHGTGHIERTMLHGAFCAMEDGLDEADTALLLDACSYHDVGRQNDWLDTEHGHRSAQVIGKLTERTGQELVMLQAAVDAHSQNDKLLEQVLQSYQPEDYPRTLRLATLLKDADGLDRVRIHDLKTSFLRRPASVERADFAMYLFARYETKVALREPFKHGAPQGMNMPENRGETK